MAAFLVVDTAIENVDEYEKYKALAKPIAEKYDGVYRARGGDMDVLETDLWTPTRMVIAEFPDMQAARAFVNSEEYAPVKPLRRNSALHPGHHRWHLAANSAVSGSGAATTAAPIAQVATAVFRQSAGAVIAGVSTHRAPGSATPGAR
jgi:uncharacterized protein (DUF1330 family)